MLHGNGTQKYRVHYELAPRTRCTSFNRIPGETEDGFLDVPATSLEGPLKNYLGWFDGYGLKPPKKKELELPDLLPLIATAISASKKTGPERISMPRLENAIGGGLVEHWPNLDYLYSRRWTDGFYVKVGVGLTILFQHLTHGAYTLETEASVVASFAADYFETASKKIYVVVVQSVKCGNLFSAELT